MSHDAHHRYEWNTMPWRKLEVKVFKLQRRIYQATTRGETKKAHRLQKLLASSWSAKSLAVRRVTQENTGKKTAGVDGASNLTPPQRLQLISTMDLHAPVNPGRRMWIPKPGTPEKRPLGIPIMHDRGTQALAKIALEPEWEAKFEPNSFGCRPGRSCQDAIRQIYNVINLQPRYVLDADIASCFDRTPSYPCQQPTGRRPGGSRGHRPQPSAVRAPLCAACNPPAPPQCGLYLRRLPRHHGAADSPGGHQSGHATARVPTADSTYLACHNRAHCFRGAMRGAMPCNPTQLWTQLSPTWQTRIRADLTALFQEVIDAQLRPDYAPTSGPQGRH
jgi:hypothetical protein